MHGSMNVKTEV